MRFTPGEKVAEKLRLKDRSEQEVEDLRFLIKRGYLKKDGTRGGQTVYRWAR